MERTGIRMILLTFVIVFISVTEGSYPFLKSSPRCYYGERGSLTATCENATSSFFRSTTYRFDSLDETVKCINCNLDNISSNSFDISGNHILILDLKKSNINSLASSSFVGLVYMERLDLSSNNIKTIIPGTFKGIKKLKYLSIADNKITMLINSAFAELRNLTELYLNNNEIVSVDAGAFDNLSALKELYLQDNKITHFENASLGLTSIKLINLANNNILDLSPKDINSSTLLDLNLSGNKLRSIGEYFILATSLLMLNLSSNGIETISPGAFKGCRSLEYVDLQHNKISALDQSSFIRLYNLRDLNLAFNSLSMLQTYIFTHLPELRYLNVSHNQILSLKRRGVLPLHNLHSLDVSYNNITYFDYKLFFEHAPRLVLFHLENNSLPCYLVKEMKEYFQHDGIEFSLDDKYGKIETTCNDTATKPPPEDDEYYKDIETRSDKLVTVVPSSSSPNVYIIYSFLFIIIGLIVVLFYLQYKTYLSLKYGHQGDIAQVGLMSSRGLESRDNDY